MKVRRLSEIANTKRQVKFSGGESFRLLLAGDDMGFSLHHTVVNPGTWHWHYKNHLEACYCISGKGEIKNLQTSEIFKIEPGTIYILNDHDNHEFTAYEETILVSVFNPPIVGNETHDKNGNYELKNINDEL